MGIAVVVALAPGQTALASGRAVVTTSLAVIVAPLTVGAQADATSLRTALAVVPVVVALAAGALTLVQTSRQRAMSSRAGSGLVS